MSNGVTNIVFGLLYWIGSLLQYHFPDYEYLSGEKIFVAIFCILFGSFAASGATAFMPDVAAAKAAAVKICTVLKTPSKIDPLETKDDAVKINEETFRGEIEFKDVWFRYPENTA